MIGGQGSQGGRSRGHGNGRKERGPRGGRGGGNRSNSILAPLTPRELNRQVQAETRLKFRPLEKAISGEIRASERRVKDQGNWWQNYLNTVNAGQADTSAAYAQAAQTGQDQIAQASAVDTANTQRLQEEAAKSAELRGVTPSTEPAERAQAMQAQRNYLASAQGGTTALLGANQRAYLNDQKRIGVGQSIASRKEEQRRGRSYRKDLLDTRGERGPYAVERRGQLREAERNYGIKRSAFNLDKKEAAQQGQEAAAERGIARREREEGRQQWEIEEARRQRELELDESEASKGGNGEARADRKDAWAAAKSLFEKKQWRNWNELETRLRKETEVSPSDARWAIGELKRRYEKEQREKERKGSKSRVPWGF